MTAESTDNAHSYGVVEDPMVCQCCHDTTALFERGLGQHRLRLCLKCLSKSGLHHLDGWRILLEHKGHNRCNHCFLSWEEFCATGRLGCPSCRSYFSKLLDELLEPLFKAELYQGRAEQVMQEANLELALLLEDYEMAARIRDQLEEKST
jgi:protein-arginine kinase activator protein McsA